MKKIFQLALIVLLFSSCSHNGPMDEYNGCGLEGDAKRQDVRELNTQKNRYDFPDSGKIDKTVSLATMLAPGEDRNRFTAGHAVEITGFVIDVKVGGDESCNCHAHNPEDRDTHIELVLPENDVSVWEAVYGDKAKYNEKNCVIVEVTPRMRAIMVKKGVDWSTDNIRKMFKGQYVKVKGWLLFDEEHERQALNTAPNNPKDWRATCWEIHPVTSIEIYDPINKGI